jgi:hypothetical protein
MIVGINTMIKFLKKIMNKENNKEIQSKEPLNTININDWSSEEFTKNDTLQVIFRYSSPRDRWYKLPKPITYEVLGETFDSYYYTCRPAILNRWDN